jgi:hypothetical protein
MGAGRGEGGSKWIHTPMNDPSFVDVLDGLEDRADEISGITANARERDRDIQ